MYKAYSKNELRVVHDIITTFGHVTYQDGSMLETEFFISKKTKTATHQILHAY